MLRGNTKSDLPSSLLELRKQFPEVPSCLVGWHHQQPVHLHLQAGLFLLLMYWPARHICLLALNLLKVLYT